MVTKKLRAHDHIKKKDAAAEHPQKFHPKRQSNSTLKVKKEKKVTTATSQTTADKTATGQTQTASGGAKAPDRVPVDPRVMQMVVAVLPAVGEAIPSDDQQKVAEQVEQIMVDALQAQEGQRKTANEGDLKAAEAHFFSADVASAQATAKKKAAGTAPAKP